MVSQAWEKSFWLDIQVVIAESSAPRFSAVTEMVLQIVASHVVLGAGWLGMGHVTFSLDDCSKKFCVIACVLGRNALMLLPTTRSVVF